MQQLPNAPQTQNERYLAQKYHEELTGDAIDGLTTITLAHPVQTTVDGEVLAQVFLNGVLVSANRSGGGGSGWTRERFDHLAGNVNQISRVGTTATVTTADALPDSMVNGLNDQAGIIISGANESEYNGTQHAVHVIDDTHFSYTVTGSPSTPATGTSIKYSIVELPIHGAVGDGPEQIFKNGGLLDFQVAYSLVDVVVGDVRESVIGFLAPPISSDVVTVFYPGHGGAGAVAIDGASLTFDQPLSASDTVVVDYEYRT